MGVRKKSKTAELPPAPAPRRGLFDLFRKQSKLDEPPKPEKNIKNKDRNNKKSKGKSKNSIKKSNKKDTSKEFQDLQKRHMEHIDKIKREMDSGIREKESYLNALDKELFSKRNYLF